MIRNSEDRNIVLQMRNISKIFPGVTALDNVDFVLERGSVHILLGENGAGKSTLVKILSGAHNASSGKILINNNNVSIRNPRHAMELGIGIIYQELNLIPHMTVAENIFLGREPMKYGLIVDYKKMNILAKKYLSDLGVRINPEIPIKNLGIAQQQMVEVAKVISLDAKILIMDEPTSALSKSEIEELFKTIELLKSNGISIIYISHRMEELFEIGDIVTILRDGKKVGTKLIKSTNRNELIHLMVNRKISELFTRKKKYLGGEVLKVNNISKNNILKNISLSIHEGEILGIAGLLGAGRTELARMIFGAERYDSGYILVNDKKLKSNSPKEAIQNGIGFLTEDRKMQGLIMKMSVKENITLSNLANIAKLGYIDQKMEESITEKYRKDLDIKISNHDQIALNLSGGNQQKVVLSKWLCSNASILILDEPTRGIDVKAKQEIYKLIDDLTQNKVSIIIISSDLPELISLSDRILVMHEGKINAEFQQQNFNLENILKCALGGVGEA